MNVRKEIDYGKLFEAVDRAVSVVLPQMELYREIGRLICERPEKGAAGAVAKHLQNTHPDASGFSPRNVRRMREFYRMYKNDPDIMREAMEIGWTQNVVILEANLTLAEREWYIRAARRFDWSKLVLAEKIVQCAHETEPLDSEEKTCYTAHEQSKMKARETIDSENGLRPKNMEKAEQENRSNRTDSFCPFPYRYLRHLSGRLLPRGRSCESSAEDPCQWSNNPRTNEQTYHVYPGQTCSRPDILSGRQGAVRIIRTADGSLRREKHPMCAAPHAFQSGSTRCKRRRRSHRRLSRDNGLVRRGPFIGWSNGVVLCCVSFRQTPRIDSACGISDERTE